MKLHTLVVVWIAFGMTGCSSEEPAQPGAAVETPPAPAQEEAVAIEEFWTDEDLVERMHLRADKVDEINFALADGDLDTAKEAATWLVEHDTEDSMPSELLPLLFAMRIEAEAVVAAPDVETAQAAAERITVSCQECHKQAGVDTRL